MVYSQAFGKYNQNCKTIPFSVSPLNGRYQLLSLPLSSFNSTHPLQTAPTHVVNNGFQHRINVGSLLG